MRGKAKLPTRAWLHDQLVERNFNALDEFVNVYREVGPELKVKLIAISWDFLFPKARPEDQHGDPGEPPVAIQVTDEQLERLVSSAKAKE